MDWSDALTSWTSPSYLIQQKLNTAAVNRCTPIVPYKKLKGTATSPPPFSPSRSGSLIDAFPPASIRGLPTILLQGQSQGA